MFLGLRHWTATPTVLIGIGSIGFRELAESEARGFAEAGVESPLARAFSPRICYCPAADSTGSCSGYQDYTATAGRLEAARASALGPYRPLGRPGAEAFFGQRLLLQVSGPTPLQQEIGKFFLKRHRFDLLADASRTRRAMRGRVAQFPSWGSGCYPASRSCREGQLSSGIAASFSYRHGCWNERPTFRRGWRLTSLPCCLAPPMSVALPGCTS